MARLVECVPNFSEGRNRAVIDAIADAIKGVADVKLLDVDPGADTNRTVFTFVGAPEPVADAALKAAHKAYELIDMAKHHGAHPRMAAMDVCPIVPISGVTMDECVEIARGIGRRIGDELQLPVYFYEYAATSEKRRSLANIRTGEYEGLERKLQDPEWAPDAGPARFDPRFGAPVVGAREFLIAYNVNLNTRDRKLANEIALNIREGGRLKRDKQGNPVVDEHGTQVKTPGRLKAVRAIGWYIEQYRQAQVSINLINFNTTPLHVVFETVREEAEKIGLIVTGSELVGLMPLQPLIDAGRFYLRKQGKSAGGPEREIVEAAIRSLGLDQLGAFDPDKKIIEYQFRTRSPLVSLAVDRFVDEVSSESPAPGGGSVAALAGSLAAGLSAMVANLTVGKKGYEASWTRLSDLAERAQHVKDQLVSAIDEDTDAFNGVMAAMRLPKATPEQQAARNAALEEGYRHASRVPLQTAKSCLDALKLSLEVAQAGNTNSASDAGVAALMARAGVEGAVLNVLINLGSVKDEGFKQNCRTETDALVQESGRLCEQVVARVKGTFAV
ncbi:MAG TPA: glutamate formimidoyltransferase [Vicinamibacterales bacterium]|jgi:glutamate formiminotransferase/formiminotetrahydrofolate cyclodeaminase